MIVLSLICTSHLKIFAGNLLIFNKGEEERLFPFTPANFQWPSRVSIVQLPGLIRKGQLPMKSQDSQRLGLHYLSVNCKRCTFVTLVTFVACEQKPHVSVCFRNLSETHLEEL